MHQLEKLQKESAAELDKRDEQTVNLAEANVNLLEMTEVMEQQTFALAEANVNLLEVTEALREEKNKTEQLLLNILPKRVAEDLKLYGKSDPESFESISVFFSDIVNFTSISSTMEPLILIRELSDVFSEFDQIFKKRGCERIKTIGDAYFSVCGMPDPDEKHGENIVNAAMDALEYLDERNQRKGYQWMMRMGIHSGPAVGGIVGIEKYIYDVFGDTINTASRMERHSEEMRINLSQTTRELVKESFDLEERKPIEIKGKGEQQMYFVIDRKDPASSCSLD